MFPIRCPRLAWAAGVMRARPFFAVLFGLFAVVVLLAPGVAWSATCFAVDDDTARIVVYDRDPPVVIRYNAVIQNGVGGGNLATERIEAAYFDSVLNRYYVVVQDTPNRFGYVDPYLGAFIAVGANMGTTAVPAIQVVGSGNGGTRIAGLTRNPVTNRWYVARFDGYLFEINPATGVFVPGAFSGNDYIQIRNSSGTVQAGIEDLAFDAAGNLFAIQNDPGPNQLLQNISLITGYSTGQVNTGINEAEGLALTNGSMRLIIGAGGGANVRNFYVLDTVTGVPTLAFNLPNAGGVTSDYEATGCNDSFPRADLAITQTVTPAAVAPGGTLTYAITLVNQGIDPAYRVQVTDQLEPGMSFVSSTIGAGCTVCSFDAGSGVWTVDKIDIGQLRTLTLVVSTAGVTPNTFVTNRAQVTQSCETATGACTALADFDSTPNNKAGAWSATEDDEATAGALVTIQPSVGKAFTPPSGVAGATATLVLTLTNANTSTAAILSANLTDTYPAGLVNAATPAAATSCTGGAGATATAGGASISLGSGASIPAGGACTVTVVVTASALGAYTNTVPAGALAVTVAGIPLTNVVGTTAQYQVTPANVSVLKDFTPDAVSPGGTSTLKITFNNPTIIPAVFTGGFIDDYPAGLVNYSTPGAQTSCAGGTGAAASAGASSVSLGSGAVIPANGACTLTVVVTASTKGFYTNTIPSGSVSTSVGSNVGPAVGVLQVDAPSVSKAFSPTSVQTAATATLIITFSNPLNTIATITQTFTDVYPAGIINYTTPAATDTCGGGTSPTATAGLGTLTMPVNTQIPAQGSCQVSVVVRGTPSATLTGSFVNSIPVGSLTTTLGSNTDPAAATLTIASLANLAVTKTASITSGTPGSTITYTVRVANLGASDVPAGNPATFTDLLQGVNLLGPVTVTWVGGSGGANNTATNVVTTTTSITADFIALSRPAGDRYAQFVFRGVPSSTGGYVTNTAAITAPPGVSDTVLGNNTSTVAVYISPTAFLTAAKTNGVNTLGAGSTTTYTLTFTNTGPSSADGAVIKDIPSAGLNCTAVSCSATGGAACGTVSVGALLAGHPLPAFPSGGAVTVLLTCTVTASGL